jgi:hypothetical protein
MNGLFLTIDSLNKLPPDVRSTVLSVAGIGSAGPGSTNPNLPDYLVRFNERQVRQLLKKPIHDTSRKILEIVAEIGPRFRVGEALDKLGMEFPQLKGALSGLTRRTRKIANDDEVILFNGVQEAEDVRDSVSEVHPDTCAALRRVLNTGE